MADVLPFDSQPPEHLAVVTSPFPTGDAVIIPGRFVHWRTVADGKIVRFEQVVDSSKVNEAL
jgi:hypothetical protein